MNYQVIVASLIAILGHDDFHRREAAQAALLKVGPLAHPQLLAARDYHPLPEVRMRCRRLFSPWYKENAQRLAESHGKLPWLCFGDYDCESVFLKIAQKQIGVRGPPEFEDWRLATRIYLEMLYARQCPEESIVDELEAMWQAEYDYRGIINPRKVK